MKRKVIFLLLSQFFIMNTMKAAPTDLPQMTTDLENPVYYTISNTRSTSGRYLYYAGADVGLKDANTISAASLFYFTGTTSACYIHNAATTKKVASVTSWTDAGVEWAINVTPYGDGTTGLSIGPKDNPQGGNCWNELNYNDCYTTWAANGAGSVFVIELAPYVEIDATKDLEVLLANIEVLLADNADNHAEAPALGQYSTAAYEALLAAKETVSTDSEAKEAIAAFEASKCLPVFTIDGVYSYAADMSIYEPTYHDRLRWKVTDRTDKTMLWVFDMTDTIVSVTDKVVVKNYATGNLFENATFIQVAETEEEIADDGRFLIYLEGQGSPAYADGSGMIDHYSSSLSANSLNAWKFTYAGTTYGINLLPVEPDTPEAPIVNGIVEAALPLEFGPGMDGWIEGSEWYDEEKAILAYTSPLYRFENKVETFYIFVWRSKAGEPFFCLSELGFYDADGTKIELTAENVTSNADHNALNPKQPDGGGITALFDDDMKTYFHSAWQNMPEDVHYLKITLPNGGYDAFSFRMLSRGKEGASSQAKTFPARMEITDASQYDAVTAFNAKYTELVSLSGTYSSIQMIPAVNREFITVQEKAYEMSETLSSISVDSLEACIFVMRTTIAYVKAMDAKYNKWKDLLYVCYDCQDKVTTATPEVEAEFAEMVDKHSAYQRNMPAATTAEIDALIAELDAAYRVFVKATTPKEHYDVTVNVIGDGSVSGSGNYEEGTEVTLTATPNSGYRFSRWSNGSTANPYVFTVSRSMNLTAEFEEIPNPGEMLIPFGQFTRQPYPVKYFKALMDSGIAPAEDWYTPDFDDSSWTPGHAPITNAEHKFYTATPWEPLKSTYWVRRTFDLNSIPQDRAFVLYLSHDDECTMYLNGHLIYETRGWTETYKVIPLDWQFATYLVEGENVITAVVSNSALNHACVDFGIYYTEMDEEIVHPNRSVAVYAGPYGRCILEGNVIEPNGSYTLSNAVEDGSAIKLYFVPFDGYTATNMKRNGEDVFIKNNVYEEIVTEDVAFTDINFVTSVGVDTIVITETVLDTFVVTVPDTILVEKTDTVFIAEIEELLTPVIAYENGIVTITSNQDGAIILYAINGDPLEGSVYTGPFEVTEGAVVSAIAVRSSEAARMDVIANGVSQSKIRVMSRRYYSENGVEVASPKKGITIVVVEYENGTIGTYKMVKN